MPPLAGAIVPLIMGGLSTGAGLLGGRRANSRNQSNQINNLNFGDALIRQQQELGGTFLPPAFNPINSIANQTNFGLTPGQEAATGEITNATNIGNEAFRNVNLGGSGLISGTPTANNAFTSAQGLLGRGGSNAQLDFLRDRSQDLFGLANSQPIADANLAALDIINNRGQTADTQALISELMSSVNAGGQTEGTQQLAGQGASLLAGGGFTPELNRINRGAEFALQRQGFTDRGGSLFDTLGEIVNSGGRGGALLSDDQVRSFAIDRSAALNEQSRVATGGDIQRRFGGSGIAGGGIINDLRAAGSNQEIQQTAQTLQQAELVQQQARLQQELGAAGVMANLNQSASGVIGSAFDLQGNLARSASQNVSSGAQLSTAAQSIAAQNFANSISGVNSAIGNEIQNLVQAGFGGFNQGLQNINNLNSTAAQIGLGTENQITNNLGLGLGTMNTLTNQQLALGQNETDLANRQANFGLTGANTQFGANSVGVNQQLEAARLALTGMLGANSNIPGLFGSRTNTIVGVPNQNPAAPLGGAGGAILGSLIPGFNLGGSGGISGINTPFPDVSGTAPFIPGFNI